MNEKAASRPSTVLAAKWRAINARQQGLIRIASSLLMLALVWWTLMAPPLRVLSQAGDQQRDLDIERRTMQSLQSQAQRLLALPKISRDDAVRAIQASTKQLGAFAQLDVSADRVTLNLRAVPSNALAQWLAQARTNAYTQPLEARLTRTDGTVTTWDGVLVLGLPAQ